MIINYISTCESTQDEVIQNLNVELDNFYTIYTFDQRKGRGQSSNTWNSEKDMDLTFSFVLNIEDKLFNINNLSFWVANCLREYIEDMTKVQTYVKWPNDIIIKNKKVSGILIENKTINSKNYLVVGIGINVNSDHNKSLMKSISLSNVLGKSLDLHDILIDLIEFLRLNIKIVI